MDKRLLTVLPAEYHHRLGTIPEVLALQTELNALNQKLQTELQFSMVPEVRRDVSLAIVALRRQRRALLDHINELLALAGHWPLQTSRLRH